MKNPTTYLLFAFIVSVSLFSCENEKSQEEVQIHPEIVKQLLPEKNGQDIANQTQMTLGKNLMQAINSGGTEYAVEFCSTKAIHLTDSMAIELNASVRRVSDRNRNPDNAASAEEMSYINSIREAIANGQTVSPKITTTENKNIGYYPILTNQMCMQCHGNVDSEISPETLSKINTLYPDDLATGYSTNELRGIWVIEMDK